MKKLFFLLLFSSILVASSNAQVTNAVFKPKGKVSSNIENANKETDPTFTAFKPAPVGNTRTNSNNKKLSQLEQGMNIVEDIVDKLIEREYSFSLLSGHKYMVNNCLGIKASAGQFDLKFANPEITLTGGKFKVKLEIDKIKFSAFKVRSRPRVPDFSDPDPCHFSGKFEVGGEATNVSVRLTLDLVAVATSTTASYCALAFGEPAQITWNIGGFNLRPMPNAIDNVAKEMVEDALNNGMIDLVYNRLMAAAKAILPEYFDACETPGNLTKEVENISNQASTGTETDKSSTKPVTGLAKNMGRLNLVFPKDVEWDVDIYSAANKFITNRSSVNKHTSYPLAAGNYNVRLNTVRVDNLAIQQGKETRIKSGILNVTLAGPWELRTEDDKFLTSGNKPKKIALPVGRYLLKQGKDSRVVVIHDQQESAAEEEEEEQIEKWKITETAAGGIMGNLGFKFPENARWVLGIFNESDNEYVRTISESNELSEFTLGPGMYKLVLNNVPVTGVPIEGGKITDLKVGVLEVKGNSSWSIWDKSGQNHFKTENGAMKMIFPIGKYVIKVGGASVSIEVKDGETIQL